MNRRQFLQSMGVAGLGATILPSTQILASPAKVYAAKRARDFLDSIGVATHWRYSDTPYGFDYERVRDRLIESGIRHVRDGFSNRIQDLGEKGIKSTIIADLANNSHGDIEDIKNICDRIKRENENGLFIDAVEGPNEVDIFWDMFKKTYKGDGHEQGQEGIIKGAVQFQKDLYTTLKSDTATEPLTVLGLALGRTYDPGGGFPNPIPKGELTDFVDWGNFHPYPGGGNPFSAPSAYAGIQKYYWQSNFPSINLDEYPYAFHTYQPPYAPKPMASTETGWSTYKNGISERTHGKYIPRLYAEYFRLGIQRAYIYEFIDEFKDDNKTNREANFGLLRRDTSAKPGFTAIKNLISLLQDDGPDFEPGELDYEFRRFTIEGYGRKQYVHQLVLQKSDGDFYILLWHEISAEDISKNPNKQLEHPDMPVELEFNQPVSDVVVYRYNEEMEFEQQTAELVENKVALDVPDEVMVVRVTPDTSGVGQHKPVEGFRLYQNHPNPCNPSTTITYSLPQKSHVRLSVHDLRGRLLTTLVDETKSAGVHHHPFSNSRLPSGTYFYRMQAGEFSQVRQMVVVR